MGQILIRNLDDTVIEAFKTRARLKGTSLEQEVRELLTAHRRLTPEEKVAISREFRSRTRNAVQSLTTEERREGLE
jgi:antitoxin FitA